MAPARRATARHATCARKQGVVWGLGGAPSMHWAPHHFRGLGLSHESFLCATCIALYCIVLYCIVLYCIELRALRCCIALHCIALHYTELIFFELRCLALRRIAPHCAIALHFTALGLS